MQVNGQPCRTYFEDAMTIRRAALAVSLAAFASALPAAAEGPDDILPEAPAKVLVVRACTSCHQAPQIVAKRRTADDWDVMLGKMVDRGARLTEAEQDQVYDYLVTYFGPEPPPPATPAPPPGSTIP
jgi:hypothetical protein